MRPIYRFIASPFSVLFRYSLEELSLTLSVYHLHPLKAYFHQIMAAKPPPLLPLQRMLTKKSINISNFSGLSQERVGVKIVFVLPFCLGGKRRHINKFRNNPVKKLFMIRRVPLPPCTVKTCAVRPVFARVVGELQAADPSKCPRAHEAKC